MPGIVITRYVATRSALAFSGILAFAGCAAKYSQVAPRVDLQQYHRIALVTFSAKAADSSMSTLATQRFAEELLASQSGVELLELGAGDASLQSLLASGDAAALAQALGREKNVPAVFVGQLQVSKLKPRGHVSSSDLTVRTSVSAELTVRLLSTSTGGTVWRSSAAANGTVGRMDVRAGQPSIAVRDPEQAYGEVVRTLVAAVTRDFRRGWVKQ